MKKNKFTTYLLYAIGEIVLVVIGILIAVSLNNWNQVRIQKKEALKLLSDFSHSIEEDFTKYGFLLYPYLERDSIQSKILDRTLELKDLSDGNNSNPLTFVDFTEFYWDDNINTILSEQRIIPTEYASVINDIRSLKSVYGAFLLPQSKKLNQLEEENLKMLSGETWLYQTNETAHKERLEYFLGNVAYRNRLHAFKEVQKQFVGQSARFQMLLIKIWSQLELQKNDVTTEGLIRTYQKFELVEMKPLPCDTESHQNTDSLIHEFIFWNIIYNSTDEDYEIYWSLDEDEIKDSKDLIPPGAVLIQSTKADDRMIYIGRDNQCEKFYESNMNGFIII